ncbi:MAG: type IV pilin protein [Gammaproteobacteria bacterium]
MPCRSVSGFTLMELLITLSIISILILAAMSSYRPFVLESKRVDAMDALQDLAARQERYFFLNDAYTADESELGFVADGPQASGMEHYRVRVSAADALSYTLEAIPVGDQAEDSVTGFELDSAGLKRRRDSLGVWTEGWGE